MGEEVEWEEEERNMNPNVLTGRSISAGGTREVCQDTCQCQDT